MELPSFIDEDIVYSIGFWILTLGTMIAFLIGFKLSGVFGVVGSENEYNIPFMVKLLLILLTPVMAYLVSLKIFK